MGNMKPPTTKYQVHEFIGLSNCYMDMWYRRSHFIQPLTSLTSDKVRFKCRAVEQKSFDDIEGIVVRNTLLAYLYFTELFDIHMDDSNYHLGGVIIQSDKPIAFYIQKLTRPQTRYTVTEKELRNIVETSK